MAPTFDWSAVARFGRQAKGTEQDAPRLSLIAPVTLATAPARAARILVVDDEPRMLSMMRRVLEVDGYSVVLAGGGTAALEILRRESVDLVILDVMMPDLDGFEVCRTVRR